MKRYRVLAIIPALNEEASVARVIKGLIASSVEIDDVLLIDNGSTDQTARVAEEAGATVLSEPKRGYGAACLCGLEYIEASMPESPIIKDIIVFLDADGSDEIDDLPALIEPIISERSEFVVGSRLIFEDARQAVPFPSRVGNLIATNIIWLLYGVRFTDLGPFRAIRRDALRELRMTDTTWGWTVEMQLKASKLGMRLCEVPVRYRERIAGESKISGNLIGGLKAAQKILYVLGKHVLTGR